LSSLNILLSSEYVIYKNWLCRVEQIEYELTISFVDGSVCIMKEVYEEDFDLDYPFYPTQILNFDNSFMKTNLKNSKWKKGKYQNNFKEGIILLMF
jgi:hypothetical protein